MNVGSRKAWFTSEWTEEALSEKATAIEHLIGAIPGPVERYHLMGHQSDSTSLRWDDLIGYTIILVDLYGGTLAFVEARAESAEDFRPTTVLDWYSSHHLFLLAAGSSLPVEVPGTQGAAAPAWSAEGRSILYVAGNYLWLLARTGSRPVKVAGPVLVPSDRGPFFGEVNWQSDFAWSQA